MNAFHQFFMRLTLREKILLVLFSWVIILGGLRFTGSRLLFQSSQLQAYSRTLADHRTQLDLGPIIEQSLVRQREAIDSNKTRSSAELQGFIGSVVKKTQLKLRNFPVQTQAGELFDWHEMNITFTDASLPQIIQFQQSLLEEAPYINIESITLRGDRTNEEALDATFRITSFELKTEVDLASPR